MRGLRFAHGFTGFSTGVLDGALGNAAQLFPERPSLVLQKSNETVSTAIALGTEIFEKLGTAGRIFIRVHCRQMCGQNVHITDPARPFAKTFERLCEV